MPVLKCAVTGKDTLNKSKGNIPLHRDGREELNRIYIDFNQKLEDAFVEEQLANNNGAMVESALRKLAPKFSKNKILREIKKASRRIIRDFYKGLKKLLKKSVRKKKLLENP